MEEPVCLERRNSVFSSPFCYKSKTTLKKLNVNKKGGGGYFSHSFHTYVLHDYYMPGTMLSAPCLSEPPLGERRTLHVTMSTLGEKSRGRAPSLDMALGKTPWGVSFELTDALRRGNWRGNLEESKQHVLRSWGRDIPGMLREYSEGRCGLNGVSTGHVLG